MKDLRWGIALAVLALGGCDNGAKEAQEAAARQAQAEMQAEAEAQARAAALLKAQQACITGAMNNSVLSSLTGEAFFASFEQQNLTNCPADFIEKFVALGNSVQRYGSTIGDLSIHEKGRDAAVADGIWVTLRDSYQGTTSDDSPMTDWMMENNDLKQREAALRREAEDNLAAVKVTMVHYGVTVQSSPEMAPPNDTGESADYSAKK